MTKWVNGCEVHDKPDEQMCDDAKLMTNQTNGREVHDDAKFMTM